MVSSPQGIRRARRQSNVSELSTEGSKSLWTNRGSRGHTPSKRCSGVHEVYGRSTLLALNKFVQFAQIAQKSDAG